MDRPIDPRLDESERPDLALGRPALSERGRAPAKDDARDVFCRGLDLPRGSSRECVRIHAHEYKLHGSEVRTLATVGTFRVVPAEELRRPTEGTSVLRKDLEHLRDAGLVRTMPYVVGRHRTTLVTLTEQGREVLESRRPHDGGEPQTFYAGVAKNRDLAHDVRLHRAYVEASERLISGGSHVHRVVLDHEMKREYQSFLQEPNRGRRDSTGRPQRDPSEIARWAEERHLPMLDGSVQFPDLRIEYDRPDGRRDVQDVEIITPHYRGAHAASKVSAGFTQYRATGARLGGVRGGSRGGRARDSRLSEEMLG